MNYEKDRWGNPIYLLPYIKTGECNRCKQPRVGNSPGWVNVCKECMAKEARERWQIHYRDSFSDEEWARKMEDERHEHSL